MNICWVFFNVKQMPAIKADGGKFSQRKAACVIDTVVIETMTEETHEADDVLKINQISAQKATGLNHTREQSSILLTIGLPFV